MDRGQRQSRRDRHWLACTVRDRQPGCRVRHDLPDPASGAALPEDLIDKPDVEPDTYLDPVAGHGMFIAGIVHQYAPRVSVRVAQGLSTYGNGSEVDICRKIDEFINPDRDLEPAARRPLPNILSLSFGTYAPEVPKLLENAIKAALAKGILVVASAGNDGTSRRQYPAAYAGVISVAALGPDGPAAFSNWGEWVRACAPGVDVASCYWMFDGKSASVGGADEDRFEGWALWSGTSFATPIVAAALARELQRDPSPAKAVARVIDHPRLYRLPCYGTVVNPAPGIASL